MPANEELMIAIRARDEASAQLKTAEASVQKLGGTVETFNKKWAISAEGVKRGAAVMAVAMADLAVGGGSMSDKILNSATAIATMFGPYGALVGGVLQGARIVIDSFTASSRAAEENAAKLKKAAEEAIKVQRQLLGDAGQKAIETRIRYEKAEAEGIARTRAAIAEGWKLEADANAAANDALRASIELRREMLEVQLAAERLAKEETEARAQLLLNESIESGNLLLDDRLKEMDRIKQEAADLATIMAAVFGTIGTAPTGFVQWSASMQASLDEDIAKLEEAQRAWEEYAQAVQAQIDQIAGIMADDMVNALDQFISGTATAAQAFSAMIASILRDLARLFIRQALFSAIGSALGGLFSSAATPGSMSSVISATGSGSSAVPGIDPMAAFYGRAGGGPVSRGGSYIVGEHEPERFYPNTSGRIGKGGGEGITVQFTQNVNGGDPKQVKAAALAGIIEALETQPAFRRRVRGA